LDTLTWLARGLLDFRPSDPPPPNLQLWLVTAFASDFSGASLVNDLAQQVSVLSHGRAALQVVDVADFPPQSVLRGPGAYLRFTRDQLLTLDPSDPAIKWVT